MFSIKIDANIIEGISEVNIESIIPHEKVLVDKNLTIKGLIKAHKILNK